MIYCTVMQSNKQHFGNKNPAWKGGVISQGKYKKVLCPGHPRVSTGNYVYEHILVVEKVLGKFLKLPHEVHHFDSDGFNNEPSNLVVCENREYHMLLEQRQRAYAVCGHATWRKCYICKEYDKPENLYINGTPRHKECYNRESLKRYHKTKVLLGGNGKFDVQEALCMIRDKGMTLTEVSRYYGLHRTTVGNYFRKHKRMLLLL